MRAHEMRELTDQELSRELESSYKEILNLRIRLATKQLTNTSQIRIARKKHGPPEHHNPRAPGRGEVTWPRRGERYGWAG